MTEPKQTVLIADDDPAVASALQLLLRRSGFDTVAVATAAGAVEAARSDRRLDLALVDMNYSRSTSGEEGLTLLRELKLFRPEMPVVLMTAWATYPLAVKGIQTGAADFVTKPWDNRALLRQVRDAIALNSTSRTEDTGDFDRTGIIGESPQIGRVLATLRKVAPTDAPVLITGENGTGKELVAQALHANSRRRNAPFVKVNLGGLSQTLFESEMFGHKKGAFTGAVADRPGRFATADKGTIFLDEIGELDAASQVKMLRVLQEQTFEPLGSDRTVRTDVRVVCATNADLAAMVADRTFREDLLYRINLITVHLPPLRERRGDIPLLVAHFARQYASETPEEGNRRFADGAVALLSSLPWPGNIRELRNTVRKCLLLTESPEVTARDVEAILGLSPAVADGRSGTAPGALDSLQAAAIRDALEANGHNLSKTAKALGITRPTLYRRMEKYNLNR